MPGYFNGDSSTDSHRRAGTWDPDGPGPIARRLVVTGTDITTGSSYGHNVAWWDEASGTWTALPLIPLLANENGPTIAGDLPNGDLLVATNRRICRWGGTSWVAIGQANPRPAGWPTFTAMQALPNGNLVVVGDFTSIDGVPCNRAAQWNGTSWSPLGLGPQNGPLTIAVTPNGDVFVGGKTFTTTPLNGSVRRWDGSTWSSIGIPQVNEVNKLATLPNGNVVALALEVLDSVDVWDGAQWTNLPFLQGPGSSADAADVSALPNGDIVAACRINRPSGVTSGVHRWTGASWQLLGESLPHQGWIYPRDGGRFYRVLNDQSLVSFAPRLVGEWDGSQYRWFGNGLDGAVQVTAALPGGQYIAAGEFIAAGGRTVNGIARWTGSSWVGLGSGLQRNNPDPGAYQRGGCRTLAVLPNGDLLAGGSILLAGGAAVNNIARWNGTSWSSYGPGLTGTVNQLLVEPGGDVLAGGSFSFSGASARRVARWNGVTWSSLGTQSWNGVVNVMARHPNGDLIVGGTFTLADGVSANRVARWDGQIWWPMGSGLPASGAVVNALICLPDGRVVAGGLGLSPTGGSSAQTIAVWNGSSWANFNGPSGQSVLAGSGVKSLLSLQNGTFVAAGEFGLSGPSTFTQLSGLVYWDGIDWRTLRPGFSVSGEHGVCYGEPGSSITHAPDVRVTAALDNGRIVIGGLLSHIRDGQGYVVSAHVGHFEPTCLPTVISDAGGCVQANGQDAFRSESIPWVGSLFRATGRDLPSPSFVLAVTGLNASSIPLAAILPPSAAPCILAVSPDFFDVSVCLDGRATSQVMLPMSPQTIGMSIRQQIVVMQVDAAISVVQTYATNALTVTIGGL